MQNQEIEHSLDNKKYTHEDLVTIACNECAGCSDCCHEMGDSIVLDPYDIWNFMSHMRLAGGAQITFDILVSEDGPYELSVYDGIIMPNIKMVAPGKCPFLSEQGRCTIHPIRSGLCRLYPLGRLFEVDENDQESLSYYILDYELGCKIKNRTNVKVSDWIGIPDIRSYEDFLIQWHQIKRQTSTFYEQIYLTGAHEQNVLEKYQLKFLEIFYMKPYKNFFEEFDERIASWKDDIQQKRSYAGNKNSDNR